MAFTIWTVQNNYNLGVINDTTYVDQLLPISYNVNPSKVTFEITSGKLPDGVILLKDRLLGTPFNTSFTTQYKFTITATYNNETSSRTLYLTIKNLDIKIWSEYDGFFLGKIYGLMDVNINLPVTYQDVNKEEVKFNIISGKLPYGLSLDNDRIIGKLNSVQQILDYDIIIRAYYKELFFDITVYLTVDIEKPVWTVVTGYNFGLLQERKHVEISLPINYGAINKQEVSFSIITGRLPNGLLLIDDKIIGTPFEVPRITDFKFVIRCNYNNIISDRTFYISIDGKDEPVWITKEGLLPIGINNTYFVLDDTYVDFQLKVIDYDTFSGQKLKFFIPSDAGELPPGLELTEDGRIVGWIQPAIDLTKVGSSGFYDTTVYDYSPYDFGMSLSNGFDSYIFDGVIYDYSQLNTRLGKLNRNYEFEVNVSDGDTLISRKFRIYVVGDDSYLTGSTYNVRTPTWISDSDLGIKRANNYHTIVLNVYDKPYLGPLFYELEPYNDDGSNSKLPPGMQFDPYTCKIFGKIPYQPAVSKTYKFTISASRLGQVISPTEVQIASANKTFTIVIIGELDNEIEWLTDSDLGSIDAEIISNLCVKAIDKTSISTIYYRISNGSLPNGLELNIYGEIVGKVRQYNTATELGLTRFDNGALIFDYGSSLIDRKYTFTVIASDNIGLKEISRTFTLSVFTPNDRQYSNIYVKPFMAVDKRETFKTFITNPTVFVNDWLYRPYDKNFGIQSDLKMLVFAGIETKTASEVVSVIGRNHRRKRFILGNVNFAKAKNPLNQDTIYEVIYIEVHDPLESNGNILSNNIITSDENLPITIDQTMQYYVGPYDTQLRYGDKPSPFLITVDRNDVLAGDSFTKVKYPSSISLWRKRIRELGLNDRQYLPLWMKSIQDDDLNYLDYISAIPLCYCKPGHATDIILNIKNYMKNTGLTFNQFDYDIDRYIVDKVTGYDNDKYIVFKSDRTTIK